MGSSDTVAKLNQLKDFFFRLDKLLLQPLDLDFFGFIFKQLQTLMVIEEIINFASVYLVHRYCHCKISLFFLEVVDSSIKQVLNRQFLQALHGVSFTWPCLAIGKYCYYAHVED